MARRRQRLARQNQVAPADAARARADMLLRKGQTAEAITAYETAIRLDPSDTAALFALAGAADRMGATTAAVGFYERVLALEPARLEAVVNLSNAYRGAGRLSDAVTLLRTTLEASPDRAALWLSLGNAMREAADRTNARLFFEEALRLQPDYPQALGNLADLTLEEGRTEDALDLYARAAKLAPKNAALQKSYGLALLQTGRLDDGWRAYEHRFKAGKPLTYGHGLKRWRGEDLTDRTLLITAEQGIGDQIMFAALLQPLLSQARDSNARLLMDCEPRLVSLLARSVPDITVHATQAEDRGTAIHVSYPWLADAGSAWRACPIGSLAAHMPDIPAKSADATPYLKAAPHRVDHWRNWLATLPAGPKVGICWRSGKTSGLRAEHYAPLSHWAGLLRTPGVSFVCVQYDQDETEITELEAQSGASLFVPPALDQKHDIDDTCALLSALDYVMTAPTAVAYQAAAVGTPALRLLTMASWTRLGGTFDAFAPLCDDLIGPSPGDWNPVFLTAMHHLETLKIGH